MTSDTFDLQAVTTNLAKLICADRAIDVPNHPDYKRWATCLKIADQQLIADLITSAHASTKDMWQDLSHINNWLDLLWGTQTKKRQAEIGLISFAVTRAFPMNTQPQQFWRAIEYGADAGAWSPDLADMTLDRLLRRPGVQNNNLYDVITRFSTPPVKKSHWHPSRPPHPSGLLINKMMGDLFAGSAPEPKEISRKNLWLDILSFANANEIDLEQHKLFENTSRRLETFLCHIHDPQSRLTLSLGGWKDGAPWRIQVTKLLVKTYPQTCLKVALGILTHLQDAAKTSAGYGPNELDDLLNTINALDEEGVLDQAFFAAEKKREQNTLYGRDVVINLLSGVGLVAPDGMKFRQAQQLAADIKKELTVCDSNATAGRLSAPPTYRKI